MALTVTHGFVSPVTDLNEPGIVGPDEWNDAHTVSGTLPPSQGGAARNVREVTSGASENVDADDDDIIFVNKTVAGAITINLPAAADRSEWRPIKVVDGKGDADSNNITVNPSGSEKIAVHLDEYVINFAGGSVEFWPRPDGSGWYI